MKSALFARICFWGAPLLALAMGMGGPHMGVDASTSWVLGIGGWMLVWWVAESAPLAATSLLPIILFPLSGVMTIAEATTAYGSHYVFLFLGGFLLALALEKWDLHRRLAWGVLSVAGTSPRRLVGAVMLVSALLSMWISNTATTLMMLPIAMSILTHWPQQVPGFVPAMLLGTAYAASIGGMATLIGTPPNVAMAGILSETHGVEIPFLDWMMIATPTAAVLLIFTYFLLTRVIFRLPSHSSGSGLGADWISGVQQSLGEWTPAQKRVAWVFVATACGWIVRDPLERWTGLPLSDTGIAVMAGVLLFLIPAGPESPEGGEGGSEASTIHPRALLQWSDTERLPWDILLLFGGGLTLAEAMAQVGLVETIANGVSGAWSGVGWVPLLVLITLAIFMTEGMSNLALTVVMVPVVSGIAVKNGLHPALFAVPIALASSCAFMLPMATPPNAIVFGSRQIRMSEMIWAGWWLNLFCIAVVFALAVWVLPSWCMRL
jgi:sodium-dependent dicarboxylate transporter 2/3/5